MLQKKVARNFAKEKAMQLIQVNVNCCMQLDHVKLQRFSKVDVYG